MAQCGTKVTDEVISAFDEVKQKHKYKYVTFKLNDTKQEIIVDTKVESSTYEEFQASLPSDDARWSIYDFDYKNREGQDCNKLILFGWCPDEGANIKIKMRYGGSTEKIKKKFPATMIYEANHRDDLNFDKVRDEILRDEIQ